MKYMMIKIPVKNINNIQDGTRIPDAEYLIK